MKKNFIHTLKFHILRPLSSQSSIDGTLAVKMSCFTLTHALVDDLRLATRLSDTEGRYVRRYLEQHAEPESTRRYFKDGDALRTAALVFDKAVDVGVFSHSVALGIEHAHKSAIAGELKARLPTCVIAPPKAKAPNPQPASEPAPLSDENDDSSCVVCMDNNRNATMQCGHANLCFVCGEKMSECPTCRAPKQSLIKLYQ